MPPFLVKLNERAFLEGRHNARKKEDEDPNLNFPLFLKNINERHNAKKKDSLKTSTNDYGPSLVCLQGPDRVIRNQMRKFTCFCVLRMK